MKPVNEMGKRELTRELARIAKRLAVYDERVTAIRDILYEIDCQETVVDAYNSGIHSFYDGLKEIR